MKNLQRSGSQVVLLVLSLVGVGIAIYLTLVHYENAPLVCSDSGLINCARVLSSSYSVVPGTSVPITLPGLGWSVVSAALAAVALYGGPGRRWIRVTQFAWALLGMLTVLYLVYVEIVRLRTICAWCTAFHVLVLLVFLVTVVQLQSQSSDASELEKDLIPTGNALRTSDPTQPPVLQRFATASSQQNPPAHSSGRSSSTEMREEESVAGTLPQPK